MLTQYIGTKIIRAEPMTRAAYNLFRGWTLPADESGDDAGYLVEYLDGGKPNVPSHAGYVSWSPAEQFDAAYRPCTAMTFGLAIEALRRGERVGRAGWNGKGMWVTMSGNVNGDLLHADKFWAPANKQFAIENGGHAMVQPCFTMKNAAGQIQMGWAPTQSDMLAEDWAVVREVNHQPK